MPRGDVSGPRPKNPRIYNSVAPGSTPRNPLSDQARRNMSVASERSLKFESMEAAIARHRKELKNASKSFFKKGTR